MNASVSRDGLSYAEWRSCRIKVRLAGALRAFAEAQRNNQRAYFCSFCSGYHLASK